MISHQDVKHFIKLNLEHNYVNYTISQTMKNGNQLSKIVRQNNF